MEKKPSHRLEEREAVRTTIVGGRPPGSGKALGPIPRGIEVLVKKASVDPAFRLALLNNRAAAANEIGLKLEPAEAMMLNGAAAPQLEAIIGATRVHPTQRSAFLTKVAAVMLAAMGLTQVGCEKPSAGIRRPTTDKAQAGGDVNQPVRPAGAGVETIDNGKIIATIGARVELPATTASADRPEAVVAQIGVRQERPATTQSTDRPDIVAPVAGAVPFPEQIRRAASPDRPPSTTTQATNPDTIRTMRGLTAVRPTTVEVVAGDRADVPPERPDEILIVNGIRVARPEDVTVVAGIRAPERPVEIQEVAGVRADVPASQPTSMPSTTQATSRPDEVPVVLGIRPIQKGIQPDRPVRVEPVDGVRPDRPVKPDDQP